MVATIRRLLFAIPLTLALFAGTAWPQVGTSTRIDPSIRSNGMASASGAVFWNDVTNDWANPALLGYRQGVRYEYGRTHLIPQLAPDIYFTTRRLVAGYGGIGFVNAGEPLDVGELRLDLGPGGGYEQIQTWGVGASLSRGIGALVGDAALPQLLHLVDIAAGYSEKRVKVSSPPIIDGSTTAKDIGVLARLSLPKIPLEMAYGFALISGNDATIDFSGSPVAIPRTYRNAISARLHGDIPGVAKSMLWGLLDASFSAGVAADFEKVQSGGNTSSAYHVQRYGLELSALRAFSVRVGRVEDVDGNIEGFSYGVGVGLDWRGMLGARYDFASTPVAKDSGLDPHLHHGASVFIDPLAMLSGRH